MKITSDETAMQRTFRCLLAAMSRPGRIQVLPSTLEGGGGPREPLFLVLRSLLDQEVSFAVTGVDRTDALQAIIAGRTRCPAATIGEADYIVVAGGDSDGEILGAKRGTQQYPDTSATIVFAVRSLLAPDSRRPAAALSGPGIRGEILLGPIQGLGPRELEHLRTLNADFPMGVDAVFIDERGRILCIPRSTKIRIQEN